MPSRALLLAGLVPLLALLYAQFSNISLLDLLRGKTAPSLPRSKTPILMASTPAFSHMEKITTIAEGLIHLGYPVHFVTGPDFKDYVESIGATYVPIEGRGHGLLPEDQMATFLSLAGDELEIFAFKAFFIDTIPAQHRTLQAAFASIQQEYGQDTPLVYFGDVSYAGLAPVMAGAPGLRPNVSIAIGIAPYSGASNDSFPFRSGLHPDTSADAKQVHFDAHQAQYVRYPDREWNSHFQKVLAEMGATRQFPGFFDGMTETADVLLQYGLPEFEYPRTDYRPNTVFVGAPIGVGMTEKELPVWWDDVREAKKAGKHVVAVTSSSVVFDNNALIIPALEAFKDRDDVLVIATLVTSDVEQMGYEIPTNARVAKFIPIDLALPFVSVLITNGGYGTVQQGLRAGVPMILSGVGQDKAHTGGIANYIGNGIYHAVHQTNSKMLSDAFEEILKNGTYRAKSQAIAKEYGKYNAVQIADQTIQKALRGGFGASG